jgi:restriction endonuclease
MKDKEKLLSFDTKLKFIFSHSALREGWDNPNVSAVRWGQLRKRNSG